jgi:D-amino peptidase
MSMRVLVQCDMEGISQIAHFHETLPWYPEYWDVGRDRMTDDVIAAVEGLREGGATEIVVLDGHGSGRPNILGERMPEGVELIGLGDADEFFDTREVDFVFQLGRHARCGTNNGFMPHTQTPGLRAAVDDQLLTENHVYAWNTRVPVVGATGDAALEPQLIGVLEGTPFLAVKHGTNRWESTPVYPNGAASGAAIRAFARRCLEGRASRPVPTLPPEFTLSVSMEEAAIDRAEGQHGLERRSATVLARRCRSWRDDAIPALGAASTEVTRAIVAPMRGMDFSSFEATQRAATLEDVKREFEAWIFTEEPAWLGEEPSA